MTSHYPIRSHYPGSYGDPYPCPAETTVICACGVDLWEWVEGGGCSPGTPEDAMEAHLVEVGA